MLVIYITFAAFIVGGLVIMLSDSYTEESRSRF